MMQLLFQSEGWLNLHAMSTRVIEPTKRWYHDRAIKFDQIEKENTIRNEKTVSRYKKNTPEQTFLSNYKNKN